MTTFDEREKAFERKFAQDQELKFKAEMRCSKLVGEWAAEKLGLTGAAAEAYAKEVCRADLAEKGHEDVFRKIRKDFDDRNIAVSDAEIRKRMEEVRASVLAEFGC